MKNGSEIYTFDSFKRHLIHLFGSPYTHNKASPVNYQILNF